MNLCSSPEIHLKMTGTYFYIGMLLDLIGDLKTSMIHMKESLEIGKQNLRRDDIEIA